MGCSWDIREIYKELYLGYILGIDTWDMVTMGYGYNATKTWDIIHGQSLVHKKWSSSASYDDDVSKVGDEWNQFPNESNFLGSRGAKNQW